ncbi:MFS transporter [Mycetocola spongiae]|uniref:MFS transporter n=1 Tax=Mycetocola spongiae TaxID=2859226 RepID=UPI001CF10821|nr:MFS transporter [Mycetocola spongiae]UCR90252.1 MFS transporter [Mycetocola spongiae]
MGEAQRSTRSRKSTALGVTAGLIGFLVLVEICSGIIQGFYVPLIPDIVRHLGIHDADFNWFEAAQLLLTAMIVPVMAKLGDMYGHKRMLLIATVFTALGSWALVLADNFWAFLAAWAIQGFYAVWLPLEIALIFDRGRRNRNAAGDTRRAAGLLVVALETGAILGALGGGRIFEALGGNIPVTMAVPAVAVTLVFFAILFGVKESVPGPEERSLDLAGFAMLSVNIVLITGGLSMLRLNGAETWWVWIPILVGILGFIPFGRYELRQKDPAVDLRLMREPRMWPIQLTAGLAGISVLGAQVPLSTYAGTPRENGYGLGMSAGSLSILIGAYLIAMIIGALLFPMVSRRLTPRLALIGASGLVAVGYLLLIPFHLEIWEVLMCMVIAGIGSGALVGALPAAAAAAAPPGRTGIASAMTSTTKTIGGSFSSAIFGIVLIGGAATTVTAGASSLAGYMTVWAVCGLAAAVAVVLLFFVPKFSFSDAPEEPAVDSAAQAPRDGLELEVELGTAAAEPRDPAPRTGP